ncbi:uncharacterized protein F5147DRAFT_784989 [Suillus discolor]|uniref:Uncharacterized protein n=1 Tax=Suillus discolor TaxID=1912936 RepID=A0A9P7JKD1_9AGAM|nr:uncharacterized protein F5147DRAFT_784989 [Suillus discolor]KAG2079522.1 hypothetical protein F5147DRAFT_784989 [Suillus discolor]
MISQHPVRARRKPQARQTTANGLLTPGDALLGRGRSMSASSRGSRPPSACGSQPRGNISRARSPLAAHPPLASTEIAQIAAIAPISIPCTPSSDGSLDEPITIGVRRQRVDSGVSLGCPVTLTPRSTKRLKVYANQIAEEVGVPITSLHEFIDCGGIYQMLVRIVALVLKNDGDKKLRLLANLKELLGSKDFKSALQNRLTACMLSPNITAYVTDTHPQILKFIKKHQDVFKVPALLFEDVELTALFAKVVSESLSTIRGNMKSKLTASIAKRTSITDVARSLAHGCIEVDAAHWNRLAFLRRCLRVYLLGTGNYKTVPLRTLYSPLLVPSLPKEVRQKIGPQLGIDIDEIEHNMLDGDAEEDNNDTDAFQDDIAHENAAPRNVDGDDGHDGNENVDADADHNKDDADFEADVNDAADINVDGSVVTEKDLYTAGRFWNFVDSSLAGARKAAKEQAMEDKGLAYEKAYSDILVQYLQQDLSDFPGNTKVPTLLSTNRPQWQLTIQNQLLWSHA